MSRFKGKLEPYFSGDPLVKLLPDGRNVELLEDFYFVDSYGLKWMCKKGDRTNGSSIPWFLWTVTGASPFVGKHRNASIPHDIFCELAQKSGRSAEAVHNMYREGCIVMGQNRLKANAFHKAILLGGPKWEV